MINPWKLKKQLIITEMCRNCFNKKYRLNIPKENFLYNYYDSKCSECGEHKHTVKGIDKIGMLKILFSKRTSK